MQMGGSGHYINLKRNSSLKEIAKIYKVNESILSANNNHKEFIQGEWIYIPLQRGVIGHQAYEEAVEQSEEVTDAYLNAGEFIWPVPASRIISSGVGKRWGKRHEGIDIPGPIGSAILASAAGTVQYSGDDYRGYGNLIILKHQNGLFSLYAHSKKNIVKSGQKVLKGQLIAKLGSTGHSTGPHLHFEIRKNGKVLDPKRMLAINLK
jgi:murein DD-endopeptidase MepM/ murein hydrolase activator NlpD